MYFAVNCSRFITFSFLKVKVSLLQRWRLGLGFEGLAPIEQLNAKVQQVNFRHKAGQFFFGKVAFEQVEQLPNF